MKIAISIAVICLTSLFVANAQDPSNKAQELNAQLATLFREGKLDEAVPVAEQIVALQRKETPSNSRNLLNSLENLGYVKLARFKRSMNELRSPELNAKAVAAINEKLRSDAAGVEAAFREALNLTQSEPVSASSQVIGIKNNLAWLLYNHIPPDPNTSLSFDKQSRDKFEILQKSGCLARTSEAEKLFLDALAASVAGSKAADDVRIMTLFNLAEFKTAMGDFESAIPRFEQSIALIESKYGDMSGDLVVPLESYAKALLSTDQSAAAEAAVNRIAKITGKATALPASLLNVSLRADRAFVLSNAPDVEQKARANKQRAELSSRQAIIVSGATGEGLVDQALATSTHGRSFYDNAGRLRIMRVIVKVVVDERGKVVEAEGLAADKSVKAEAEKVVRGWKFRPFSMNNVPRKMKGYVECLFVTE